MRNNPEKYFHSFETEGIVLYLILYSVDDRPFTLSLASPSVYSIHPPSILYDPADTCTCKRNVGQVEKETSLRQAILTHASKTHTHTHTYTIAESRACVCGKLNISCKGPEARITSGGFRGIDCSEFLHAFLASSLLP